MHVWDEMLYRDSCLKNWDLMILTVRRAIDHYGEAV